MTAYSSTRRDVFVDAACLAFELGLYATVMAWLKLRRVWE